MISLVNFMASPNWISLSLLKPTMATNQDIKNWNLGKIDCKQPRSRYFNLHLNYKVSLLLQNLLVVERLLWKTNLMQELNVSYISKLYVENVDSALVLVCFGLVFSLWWNCILKTLGRAKFLFYFTEPIP